jgi:hypothetical protein
LLPDLRRYFDTYSTVAFENYPVEGIPDEPVPCGVGLKPPS